MPFQYVIDMHCYQSISLVQDMVIVDVMKPQNNYIMYLTDIIITIIIVNSCISIKVIFYVSSRFYYVDVLVQFAYGNTILYYKYSYIDSDTIRSF